MQKEQDVEVAIPMIEHIEDRYELESASFDRGLKHFKNYTALGIVSYNLHRLGNLLKKEKIKELEKLKNKAA